MIPTPIETDDVAVDEMFAIAPHPATHNQDTTPVTTDSRLPICAGCHNCEHQTRCTIAAVQQASTVPVLTGLAAVMLDWFPILLKQGRCQQW